MDFRSMIERGNWLTPTSRDVFNNMRHELSRLFDEFGRDFPAPANAGARGPLAPKVNVAENEKGLDITADLPGVKKEDVALDVADNVLTIKAEHKEEREEKDEKQQFHLYERSYGTYMRRIAIPFEADEDKIAAKLENGVLKISVPRSAEPERRQKRIAIES